ncbi:hypothetical protein E4U49_007023 [Claviceps purpurea]|nr:hypothetical protein E4U49_007023 [Claviceps purpurea]
MRVLSKEIRPEYSYWGSNSRDSSGKNSPNSGATSVNSSNSIGQFSAIVHAAASVMKLRQGLLSARGTRRTLQNPELWMAPGGSSLVQLRRAPTATLVDESLPRSLAGLHAKQPRESIKPDSYGSVERRMLMNIAVLHPGAGWNHQW